MLSTAGQAARDQKNADKTADPLRREARVQAMADERTHWHRREQQHECPPDSGLEQQAGNQVDRQAQSNAEPKPDMPRMV
jgi:hypothetical protein